MAPTVYAMKLPTVGDFIHVRLGEKGEDRKKGGKSKVIRIEEGENGNGPTDFIFVEARPKPYDWYFLSRIQQSLKNEFGDVFLKT
jgi:hypothetical protein